MKHYLNLVSISDKVHRRQSRMTRICIILAVFLVAVMFGLADMYLQSMTAETKHQTGDWHAKFSAIDEETSALIAARPETELSGWQGTLPAEAGITAGTQSVAIVGIEEPTFSQIYFGTFTEGTAPATDSEAAISETAAQNLNLSAGDSVSLTLPDGSIQSFSVTGVFNDEAASLTTGNVSALLVTPQALSGLDFGSMAPSWQYVVRFSLLSKIPDTVQDILAQDGLTTEQVQQNDNLLSMLGQLPDSNVSQIYSIAFALSLVVMVTCILMGAAGDGFQRRHLRCKFCRRTCSQQNCHDSQYDTDGNAQPTDTPNWHIAKPDGTQPTHYSAQPPYHNDA